MFGGAPKGGQSNIITKGTPSTFAGRGHGQKKQRRSFDNTKPGGNTPLARDSFQPPRKHLLDGNYTAKVITSMETSKSSNPPSIRVSSGTNTPKYTSQVASNIKVG